MIKLLTKIEQDYGLPVAISFAKQAIEQNDSFLIRDLKTRKNNMVTESCIISRLLSWSVTKEGSKYWSKIAAALNEEYSISYSDLEEYAAKDPNIKTVTIDTMQKILKEPQAMIAPFNKGNLNIKGIIHQAAKGIKDARATNTTHRCN